MKNTTLAMTAVIAVAALIATTAFAATPVLKQAYAHSDRNKDGYNKDGYNKDGNNKDGYSSDPGKDGSEVEHKTSISVFKQKEIAENVVSGVGNDAGIVKCQTQASGACAAGGLTLTLP